MKKKENKIWSLLFMIMVYIFAIIGTIDLYADYVISLDTEAFIQFIATIATVCLVVFFGTQVIKSILKILKIKEL